MFLDKRKYIVVLLALFLISCKASKIEIQGKVLDALTEDVYFKHKYVSQIGEYGIVYKEFDDYNYLMNYDFKRMINFDAFKRKLSDSLIAQLFSKESLSHYKDQLLNDGFDFQKVVFEKDNIEIYSDNIFEKRKNRFHFKINVSKPIFSSDKLYSIVFSYTTHDLYMYLFKKNKKDWDLLFYHNLYSPDMSY